VGDGVSGGGADHLLQEEHLLALLGAFLRHPFRLNVPLQVTFNVFFEVLIEVAVRHEEAVEFEVDELVDLHLHVLALLPHLELVVQDQLPILEVLLNPNDNPLRQHKRQHLQDLILRGFQVDKQLYVFVLQVFSQGSGNELRNEVVLELDTVVDPKKLFEDLLCFHQRDELVQPP